MKKNRILTGALALAITLGAAPMGIVKAEEIKREESNQVISAPASPVKGITVNWLKPYVLNEKELNTVFNGFMDEIESLKTQEGFYVFDNEKYGIKDSNVYVMISLGQRSTAGYGIKVLSIEDNEGISAITIKETKPDPDMMVAQVITYPYIIVRFAQGTPNVTVQKDDGKELMPIKNDLEFKETGWINLKSRKNVSADKKWLVTFYYDISASTISESTIYVRDSKGRIVPTELTANRSGRTVWITPKEKYEPGETYYLFISEKMNRKNIRFSALKGYRMKFTIKAGNSVK